MAHVHIQISGLLEPGSIEQMIRWEGRTSTSEEVFLTKRGRVGSSSSSVKEAASLSPINLFIARSQYLHQSPNAAGVALPESNDRLVHHDHAAYARVLQALARS
jgi:hypothetical protein